MAESKRKGKGVARGSPRSEPMSFQEWKSHSLGDHDEQPDFVPGVTIQSQQMGLSLPPVAMEGLLDSELDRPNVRDIQIGGGQEERLGNLMGTLSDLENLIEYQENRLSTKLQFVDDKPRR